MLATVLEIEEAERKLSRIVPLVIEILRNLKNVSDPQVYGLILWTPMGHIFVIIGFLKYLRFMGTDILDSLFTCIINLDPLEDCVRRNVHDSCCTAYCQIISV